MLIIIWMNLKHMFWKYLCYLLVVRIRETENGNLLDYIFTKITAHPIGLRICACMHLWTDFHQHVNQKHSLYNVLSLELKNQANEKDFSGKDRAKCKR